MATTTRITRDDIEAKLREISGEVDERVEDAKPKLVMGAVAAVVTVAVLSYLFGRRGGRKRSAMVEIRRI
ncbi:MAG: hypothetical protein ACRDV4_08665 [Acidimicrobiales bacterium]